MTAREFLSREEAAQWFAARGVEVTVGYLEKLATRGQGPAYFTLARRVYYRPQDLQAWLDQEMRPVTRGRKPPQAA